MAEKRTIDAPSMRWTENETSYIWNMVNKPKIMKAILELLTVGRLGYHHLSGIVVKKDWYLPSEGDHPNYQFVFRLANEYLEFSKTLDIPDAEEIVYENVVKYLASLAKFDPAYISRFGGIMFRILKDGERGSVYQTGNAKELKFIINWWDSFEGRDRCKNEFKLACEFLLGKYTEVPFYTQSIDWILNWIVNHKTEFVYTDDMNPKKWYGSCGVGSIDNMCMGGKG
jgi:hypothetical protein